MKDLLVQPGRSLCGGGAGVADGFVGTQEGGDLCVGGEAGEEVAEDGCVFDLAGDGLVGVRDVDEECTHGYGRTLCSVWLHKVIRRICVERKLGVRTNIG